MKKDLKSKKSQMLHNSLISQEIFLQYVLSLNNLLSFDSLAGPHKQHFFCARIWLFYYKPKTSGNKSCHIANSKTALNPVILIPKKLAIKLYFIFQNHPT